VTGLEFSDNGGGSWTSLNAFTSVSELDAHGSRLAVVGRMSGDTFDHIYYSGDNGATWNEITRPGNRFATALAVAVDPWRPGTVWISTGGRAIARFTPWTPAEIWRNEKFGTHQPTGSAAPLADPDGDGLPNQVEYTTGTNPNAATPARPWQATVVNDRLALTFPRNTNARDATLTVQAADGLAGPWTDLARSSSGGATAALITGVEVIESGTGDLRAVEVRDLFTRSDPAHPKRFMRLAITVP
jgi:hypothetical protein